MTEIGLAVDLNRGALLQGLAEASRNYENAMEQTGWDGLTPSGGLGAEPYTTLQALNPDIIVPDVIGLTEDEAVIIASAEFSAERQKGYAELQYVFDEAVGRTVAREVSLVTLSEDARLLLPDRAVAIVEVNANRGFPRGRELAADCYGVHQGHLGHVVIDAYYAGAEAVAGSREEQQRGIDFMHEAGSLSVGPRNGLPRNAARILIRPSYPLVHDGDWTSVRSADMAQAIFEARLNADSDIEREARSEDVVLRSEYRICRAVGLGHDLSDWEVSDFESLDDVVASNMP